MNEIVPVAFFAHAQFPPASESNANVLISAGADREISVRHSNRGAQCCERRRISRRKRKRRGRGRGGGTGFWGDSTLWKEITVTSRHWPS